MISLSSRNVDTRKNDYKQPKEGPIIREITKEIIANYNISNNFKVAKRSKFRRIGIFKG